MEDAIAFAEEIGFPLAIRPAYTLGGTGGGFAHNMEESKKLWKMDYAYHQSAKC